MAYKRSSRQRGQPLNGARRLRSIALREQREQTQRARSLLRHRCCFDALAALHHPLIISSPCSTRKQVKDILQQLTAVNVNPTIGLAEAAELLCSHLGVSLVRCVRVVALHCAARFLWSLLWRAGFPPLVAFISASHCFMNRRTSGARALAIFMQGLSPATKNTTHILHNPNTHHQTHARPTTKNSIIGSTEGLASYILLAAHGTGAAELERDVVMKGADWSPFQLEGRTAHLYLSAADDAQALALPKDWGVLYRAHGLRSFLAVPIGTANETLGLLTVARPEPRAFDGEWWEPMLGVLAVGLLPHLRNDQVSYLCHLVRVLDGTGDYLALVALLLQGAHRMLLKTTNIKMGVRLGLLNRDQSKALIFEVDPAKIGAGGPRGPCDVM